MNIIETNLQFGSMSKRQTTKRIIVHHAAGNNFTVEAIHRMHKNNGWAGIGYHFYVRKDGSIYRGRPEWAIGAHASGSNYNSIGICAEGNFETDIMPEPQKKSLTELVSYLKAKYGISIVQRHCEVCRTACPGKNYPFPEIVNGQIIISNKSDDVSPLPNKNGKKEIVTKGQAHANNFAHCSIDTDGIRGNETMKAGIKVLQTAMNLDYKARLAVDGIFGTSSKKALSSHYVRKGETQYMVTAVQILLMLKGYDCQLENPGIFGNNLEAAVKKYQADYQLTVDGIVGHNTWMSLIH